MPNRPACCSVLEFGLVLTQPLFFIYLFFLMCVFLALCLLMLPPEGWLWSPRQQSSSLTLFLRGGVCLRESKCVCEWMNKRRGMGDGKRGGGDVAFVSHLRVLVRQSDVSVGVFFFFFYTSIPFTFLHPLSPDLAFHSTSSCSFFCRLCPCFWQDLNLNPHPPITCTRSLRKKQM